MTRLLVLVCPLLMAQGPIDRQLSLDEVWRLAESQSSAIVLAARHVDVVQADGVAAAPWLPSDPTLELGGGGRLGGGQDGADVHVGIGQTLEVFGEGGLRRDVADRELSTAKIELDAVRFQVHQDVEAAFRAAQLAEHNQRIANDAAGTAARLLTIAEAKAKAGESSLLAVRMARAAWSRAQDAGVQATAEQQASRWLLARVVGGAEVSAITPIAAVGELPPPVPLPTLEALWRTADGHPLLQVHLARREVASARQQLAGRESWPKPTVGVGYSLEGAAPSSTQTQQVFGGTLSIPIGVVHGNSANRVRADAQRTEAEATVMGVRAGMRSAVAAARIRAEAAGARVVRFTTELVPDAEQTQQLLEQGFRVGELDLTEVMTGQDQVQKTKSACIQAWQQWFIARAALESAMGAPL